MSNISAKVREINSDSKYEVISAFGKVNIEVTSVFLNDPNLNLLPELDTFCKKHHMKITHSSSYPTSIKIESLIKEDLNKYREQFELFSL